MEKQSKRFGNVGEKDYKLPWNAYPSRYKIKKIKKKRYKRLNIAIFTKNSKNFEKLLTHLIINSLQIIVIAILECLSKSR
ncbi:hypothetical protein HYE09_01505 [Mycoplasmopsis bovis]|nr:hypothetical protein [Mycoplasmopsis bovis]QQH26828.1 hypothetical protein HYE09_01505 [Mycoplasmopsis bovis]